MIGLAILGINTQAAGPGEERGFSFWGNLPCALKILEYRPQERTQPVPLTDPQKLKVCGVEPGTPLTLVRNGIVQGNGVVGQVLAGWIGRAGDDRTAYFQPAGLPDSVSVSQVFHFPRLRDKEFDFYVLGYHEVGIPEPAVCADLTSEQLLVVIRAAIDADVFSVLDFPAVKTEDGKGTLRIPEPPGVFDWLKKKDEPVHWKLWAGSPDPVEVISYPTHFLAIKGDSWSHSFIKRGHLDYFFEVDGNRYFVVRTGKAGTGAWGYCVYLLKPGTPPQLAYTDMSWST